MPRRPVDVDHVVIVSSDADDTCERLLANTGLASIPGGEHEGLGTRNRIVPLGRGYLEVLEVHDAALAAGNPFGRLGLAGLRAAREEGRVEHLAAWSAVVPSAAEAADGIGDEVLGLRRAGVSVLLTGADAAAADPARPFLIERAPTDVSPAGRPADHRVPPVGIARLAALTEELTAWWDSSLPPGETTLDVEPGDGRITEVDVLLGDGSLVRLTAESPTGSV